MSQTLIEFAKEQGATKLEKVTGPKGAFIVLILANGTKQTIPVGKRSQNGKLSEYSVLIAEDTKQPIATVNEYEQVESLSL